MTWHSDIIKSQNTDIAIRCDSLLFPFFLIFYNADLYPCEDIFKQISQAWNSGKLLKQGNKCIYVNLW